MLRFRSVDLQLFICDQKDGKILKKLSVAFFGEHVTKMEGWEKILPGGIDS